MLTGKLLGEAVAEAIRLKGVSKIAVARHFGIKGPSVYDWINHGRVGKQHLAELVAYFSDVVGPEHWGMAAGSTEDEIAPSFARLLTAANIDQSKPVTQAAIARALGVSPQTVSAWRTNGVSKDGADYAATKFNVPAAWIMYGTGMLFAQSQPARLTGDMILSAYRAARKAITLTGLEADDFSPDSDPVDADILARAILQQMAEQSTAGSPGHTEPEVGHGGSHRQDGRAGGAEGAAEAGRESKPAAGKSRKHAA